MKKISSTHLPYTLYTCLNSKVYLFTQERGRGGRVQPERRLEGQQFTKLGTDCISSLWTRINTCRKVPLLVNIFRWRHFALVSILLISPWGDVTGLLWKSQLQYFLTNNVTKFSWLLRKNQCLSGWKVSLKHAFCMEIEISWINRAYSEDIETLRILKNIELTPPILKIWNSNDIEKYRINPTYSEDIETLRILKNTELTSPILKILKL